MITDFTEFHCFYFPVQLHLAVVIQTVDNLKINYGDKEEYKHSDLAGHIIKCAHKERDFLGLGFPEIIYRKVLAIELNKAGINFQRELEVSAFYRD